MPALFALLASLCAAAEPGVVLVFPSGGTLEGVLVSESSSAVRIESDGGTIDFARAELAEVRPEPNAHSEFKRREAALAAGDAAALWELSRWALENGLPGWGLSSARRVLRLEPGHEGARALLAGPPEAREPVEEWERWEPPPPAPWRPPLAVAAPPQAVYYFMGSGALRLPPSRLELPSAGAPTGPGPWRPEPFRAGSATLGLPPPEPVGSRIGYDPLR